MVVNKKRMRFIGGTKHILAFVLISGLVFVIIEGISSTAIAVFQMLHDEPLSAPSHYDKSLGWISIPNTHIPNYYGPGKYVRTNARGFRNDAETSVRVATGKLRLICSGDSFTYGQGVANNRTWCHQLSELNDQFQTVNLGQPGYGVDQIYLRYLRDGITLEHSIHIFAFVDGDLNRMGRLEQHRYGKPALVLDDDVLVVENVPVPRFRWWVSRAVERADFRSIGLVQGVLARLSPRKAVSADVTERIGPVASRVFQTVQQLNAEKNIVSIFMFLPTEKDIGTDTAWRRWVVATMNALGSPFVDLTPALRSLPAPRIATFFIPESMPAAGHYTEAGNEWVAEVLYDYLLDIPRIQTLLDATNAPQIEND